MSYPVRRGSRSPRTSGRWDPFAEIESLHDRLDQLFFGSRSSGADWTGDVDLEETDDGWVVEAQLPGVPPEQVDVELTERELSIRGSAETRSESGQARRQYNYRLTLPAETDADRVEANLEHGVLTLKLPRSARASTRKIQVGTSTSPAAGTADTTQPPEAPAPYAPPGTGGEVPDAGTPVDAGVSQPEPYGSTQGQAGSPPPYPGESGEPASGSYPVPGQQPYPPPPEPREQSGPGQPEPYQSWSEPTGENREPHDQPT